MLSRLILNLHSYDDRLTRVVENASDLSTFMARRITPVERTIELAASSGRYSSWLSQAAGDFGTDLYSPAIEVLPSTQTEQLERQLDFRNREYNQSERSAPATQAHIGIMIE